MGRISFAQIDLVPAGAGIYEIHTLGGVPLKVGIGVNLKKRLRQHAESQQSSLKLSLGGSWSNPSDVTSTRSILAKHLYFDRALKEASSFDLTTQEGRQKFLLEKCYLTFQATVNRESARQLERVSESKGGFRYIGKVRLRT